MSRVLLVPPFGADVVGGPGRYVRGLADALARLGHDASVFEPVEGRGPWIWQQFRQFRRTMPDTIHVHGKLALLFPALAYRSLTGRPCRVVFTFHTQPVTTSYLPEHPPPRDLNRLEVTIARALLSRCDVVTTVSQSIVETLNNSFGFRLGRHQVIGSGAWPEPSPGPSPDLPASPYDPEGKGPILSTIGVFAWDWKVAGHLIAIEAMALVARRYPGAKLLIAGDGQYRGVVEDAVSRQGIHDHVTLLGSVGNTAHLLQASDIYVHMGLNEGCSLALVEAAMAGRPIVAVNRGGIPEMFEHGVTAILVEPQAQELARAIETLVDDPVKARELGQRAGEYARTHWTWPTVAARYDRLCYS